MELKFRGKSKYPFPLFISGGIKLLNNRGHNIRSMKKSVVFNDLEKYKGEGRHILFGFTVGKDKRFYYAWKYAEFIKRVEVYSVIEDRSTGEIAETKMATCDLVTCRIFGITVDTITGLVVFSCKNILNKFDNHTLTVPHVLDMKDFYISLPINPKVCRGTVASVRMISV